MLAYRNEVIGLFMSNEYSTAGIAIWLFQGQSYTKIYPLRCSMEIPLLQDAKHQWKWQPVMRPEAD
jgi:hypothetical protein